MAKNLLQTAEGSKNPCRILNPQVDLKVNFGEKRRPVSRCPESVHIIADEMSTPSKTSTAAPERSFDQRMEALRRANDIRSRRAKLKKDLKAGRVNFEELLMNPPEYLLTAKVFDMLLAVPKYGRVKTQRVLNQCRISPSKTIGGLSERQRTELVQLLLRRPRQRPARGRVSSRSSSASNA